MTRSTLPARLIAGLLFLAPAIGAAPLSDEQIRLQQQQQLDRQREQQQRRPDVFLAPSTPAPAVPAAPSGGPCFPVHRVVLDGAPPAWLGWLTPLAHGAEGRCLDLGAINQLVATLTDALVAHGFVTSRVYIPEQNLQSGQLHLVVLPGRIQAIRRKGGGAQRELDSAFPTGPGDLLNLRDLEQGLEQLARPGSQQATMELLPGDAPGASIVEVTLTQGRPLHASLSEENSGQSATGKNQLSGQVLADDLLHLNDVLTLNQSQDADGVAYPRSLSQSIAWLVPWGNWSAYFSYSASQYRQALDTGLQTLTSTGHSRNTQLSLTRLLHRDQTSKTELAFSLTRKASRSYLEDSELLNQRQDLSYLGLQLTHRQYLGSSVLNASLGYSRGVPVWGAQDDSLAAQGGPTTRPEIYSASLDWRQPWQWGGQQGAYSTTLKGQYSPSRLLAGDQFGVGGHYTVRGFDADSLAGNNGWTWRNELSWTLGASGCEAYLGLDAGQVTGTPGVTLSTQRIAGSAIGLRANLGGHLTAELTHEQPLTLPNSWARQSITHFNLTLQW
ncbi:ShlB/FhaC/HecB family hemolysin secretion/activation protein [Paludibacterium purpuratum]|uniref:Hemolysin activation/secretion protein n=1 Tax=Paludibacterium purpuratum TaxID=1144873 RepID=A0A4R7BCE6_9NEIS|nr:ShlB/FhaC/HecB family hemolysin secretion/activation protein [Paludibacterium purpuratum]TDR82618.1 hemolysin activation/secretion protein [Paludibacterium purpuratum]